MKILTTSAICLIALSALSGCETTEVKDEASSQQGSSELSADVSAAITKAKAAFDEINAQGFAWRDTEEMIQEAEKVAKLGDSNAAISLANEALAQSDMAKAQYEREQAAGPR